jgi:ribosomal protein S6
MLEADVDEERVGVVMDRVRMEAEGSRELEAGLKLTGDVMRHLLIRQD